MIFEFIMYTISLFLFSLPLSPSLSPCLPPLPPSLSSPQAVELENSFSRPVTKYLVIVTTNGYLDTEETIVLGTEQEGST